MSEERTFSIETSRGDPIQDETFVEYPDAVAALRDWGQRMREQGFEIDESWASRDNMACTRASRFPWPEAHAEVVFASIVYDQPDE